MRVTLKQKIWSRIEEAGDDVFLTKEFLDLSGRDQVIRALRQLCEEGRLIRIGYGIYSKAEYDYLAQEPMTSAPPAITLRKALDKLGVEWEESQSVIDYNSNRSTQIPVNPIPRIRGRLARKITIDGREMEYDYCSEK